MSPLPSPSTPLLPSLLRWLGLAAIILSGVGAATAVPVQEMPAPADGIYDDTRALEPPTRAMLVSELKTLSQDIKCDLWLTATSFTPSGQTLRQQLRETRHHWSPEHPAILLGYDRAGNLLGYSFSPEIWDRYPAGLLADLTRRTDTIMAREGLTIDERISEAVLEFSSTMRQLETMRLKGERRFGSPEKSLFFILSLGLIIAAVIAALLGILSRRRDHLSGQEYHLPEVAVGLRLGAPFGGGLIAEVQLPRNSK